MTKARHVWVYGRVIATVALAATVACCAMSHTDDASLPDASADAVTCRPRPLGHDCMPVAIPYDGGCPSYSCVGARRDDAGGSYCPIGGPCATEADCPCVEQRCVAGECWY